MRPSAVEADPNARPHETPAIKSEHRASLGRDLREPAHHLTPYVRRKGIQVSMTHRRPHPGPSRARSTPVLGDIVEAEGEPRATTWEPGG